MGHRNNLKRSKERKKLCEPEKQLIQIMDLKRERKTAEAVLSGSGTAGQASAVTMVRMNAILWVEDDLFYSISKGVAFQVLARKGIDQNYKCHADVYGYKRKHWHYSDLHYRHAEDIHFSNRMEN